MKLKQQKEEYIDKNITDVFHFLSLKSSHSFLIGSSNIRNIKYAVDYDLNENLKINDSVQILNGVYKEFLQMFEKAHKKEDYYIVDFKCGYNEKNNEPIRWSFEDLKNGYKYVDKNKVTFQQCLIMPNNIIKLDLVYLYHGIFTDINILYNFHIVGKKKDLQKEKENVEKDMTESIQEDIEELIKDKNYFKVLKRMFALSNLKEKPDHKLLDIFNSDLGMLYKTINSLELIIIMCEQSFRRVSVQILKENLEFIKQAMSHIMIDNVNLDSDINKIVQILNSTFEVKNVIKKINSIINSLEKTLNKEVKKYI